MKITEIDILVGKSRIIRGEVEYMINIVYPHCDSIKGKLELILSDTLKLQTELEKLRKQKIDKFIKDQKHE